MSPSMELIIFEYWIYLIYSTYGKVRGKFIIIIDGSGRVEK